MECRAAALSDAHRCKSCQRGSVCAAEAMRPPGNPLGVFVPLPLSVAILEGVFASTEALTVVRSLLLAAPSVGPACAAEGVAGMDSVAFRPFSLHRKFLAA